MVGWYYKIADDLKGIFQKTIYVQTLPIDIIDNTYLVNVMACHILADSSHSG